MHSLLLFLDLGFGECVTQRCVSCRACTSSLHTVKGTPFETPVPGQGASLLTHWGRWIMECSSPLSRKSCTIMPIVAVKLSRGGTRSCFVFSNHVLIPKLPHFYADYLRVNGTLKYISLPEDGAV
uniref:Secreted protein n=1 Tax=Malurus cyaneus samueli TaxID=2593467 RepID=A0A8C5TJP9_9PASS